MFNEDPRSSLKTLYFSLKLRRKSGWFPASMASAALCSLSLIATLLITFLLFRNIQNEKAERFDRLNRQSLSAIRTRMLAYQNALEHARALFIADPKTSMGQYHSFVTAMDLATQYPGLQAMAYAARVRGADLPNFLSTASQRVSKDYVVWPPGARDEYWPVLFTEPLDWRNRRSVGYDLKTNPERELAMQLSVDKAEATLSRKITLVQETKTDRQPGFLMIVPVFRGSIDPSTIAERRAQVIGFICGAFRAYDLFSQITQELSLNRFIDIRVYDGAHAGDPQSLLYSSQSQQSSDERGALEATTKIEVAGETWTVEVDSLKSFDQEISQKPVWFVLFGGLLVTLLVYRLGRASTRFNQSLIENENQLRLVTDSLPVLVARFDAKGIYQFANASHLDWFGVSPSLIKGQPYQNFLGNAAKDRDATFFNRALAGERVSFESVIQHRSKGLRQVKIDCVPEESHSLEPKGFIAHALDVTEQATLVKALKRGENLYRDIARENERLYRESRSLNRAKDEFLTTLSHELRTPLTVILGHAELLKKTVLFEEENDDGAKESIDSISRNASVQMQIISDLIDVSSIVTGKIALQMHSISIDEVLRQTLDKLRPIAAEKRLRLNEEIRDESYLVMGDPARLQQIISNLLTNSFKFTPAGGIVSITAGASGQQYEIEVADTGQGIDREFLPYLFDRFRQEDNSVTRRFGGLGIGLSIVRNLVEAHGGQVSASSEGQGKGASFVLRFPLLEQTSLVSEPAPAKAAVSRSPKSSAFHLDNARVLVVDDEPDTRKLIARYLERAGATVQMASSAQAAMDAYKDQRPDLVVSDIGMPVEDGYTLIRRIRALERQFGLPPVPAVALTAFARAEDRMRALDSGFQVHLTKPVTSDRLGEVCQSLIAKPKDRSPLNEGPLL